MNIVKRPLFLLLLIIILTFAIRMFLLSQNFLFGFEQGRDAQIAQDIIQFKKLTMIGPKTDIAGIFHGVWYYYLISLLYLIGNGSPFITLTLLVILNSLTGIVIYFTTFEITSNKKISLVSSLIYALSFNAIIYARWLSNVSPSIFVSALFFYFLIKFIKKEEARYWLLLITTYSLLFHFELLNGLYGGILLILLFIFIRFKITIKKIIAGVGIFTIINLPFIIFDLRHEGILRNAVFGYLLKPEHKEAKGNIFIYLSGLRDEITRTLFPLNPIVLFLFLLFVMGGFVYYYFHNKKRIDRKILLILTFSILWSFPYIFLIKEYPLDHFYAGTSVPIILLLGYLIHNNNSVVKKICLYILPFWILLNSFYIYKSLSTTSNIFYHTVQNTLHYSSQVAVMDYIFTYSNEEFHYAAFTIPYYLQDSWQYLYSWYGNMKYKKMIAKNNENKGKRYVFLIIEPSTEGYWLDKWLNSFDKDSSFISSKKFGSVQVIVRKNNVN